MVEHYEAEGKSLVQIRKKVPKSIRVSRAILMEFSLFYQAKQKCNKVSKLSRQNWK